MLGGGGGGATMRPQFTVRGERECCGVGCRNETFLHGERGERMVEGGGRRAGKKLSFTVRGERACGGGRQEGNNETSLHG